MHATVEHRDRRWHVLDKDFHQFLLDAECLFNLLSLCHIHIDAKHSQWLPRFVVRNTPACLYPMDTAVRPDCTPFARGRLSCFQCLFDQMYSSFKVIWMN